MSQGETPCPPTTSPVSPLTSWKFSLQGLKSSFLAAPTDAGDCENAPVAGSAPTMSASSEPIRSASEPAAAASAAWSGVSAWAAKAKKSVEDAAQKVGTYEPVVQAEEVSEGGSEDVEKGDVSQWSSWAMGAAEKMKQQVSDRAKEAQQAAQQGLEQAKTKANAAEWGEQAKGWSSEVGRTLGRASTGVLEGATTAGAGFSEKAKVAQQKAKDLQEKSQAKLSEAQKMGAAKAKEAKDKAGGLAGAATDKLKAAGGSLGGMGALMASPGKLLQFGGIFLFGMFLLSMSFSFLPLLPVQPQKFALLFALGSITVLGSVAWLKGPSAFLWQIIQRDKLAFSVMYGIGLLGSLWATLIARSYIFTAVFGVMQAVGLLYFLASFLPGGQAVLNFFGRCIGRCTATAARAVVPCRKGT